VGGQDLVAIGDTAAGGHDPTAAGGPAGDGQPGVTDDLRPVPHGGEAPFLLEHGQIRDGHTQRAGDLARGDVQLLARDRGGGDHRRGRRGDRLAFEHAGDLALAHRFVGGQVDHAGLVGGHRHEQEACHVVVVDDLPRVFGAAGGDVPGGGQV